MSFAVVTLAGFTNLIIKNCSMIVDCMRWYYHPSGVYSPCNISDHGNIQTKPADLTTINVVLKTGSQNGRSGNMIITPKTYVR